MLAGHTGPVLGTKAVGQGRLLSRSRDGTLRLWDLERAVCDSFFRGHTQSITAMKLLDHTTFVSSGRDGLVVQWDLRQKNKPVCSHLRHTCDVYVGGKSEIFSF